MKNTPLLLITGLLLGSSALTLALNASPEAGTLTYHAEPAADSFTFSAEQAKHRFIDDFIHWSIEDAGNLPRRDAVLAIGSSSMLMWKSIHADLAPAEILHRGFGGSNMNDVLIIMNYFQRYESATVLVYEGDNDLMGKTTVDTYVENCHKFIDAIWEVRADAEIYFISIKPSPARIHARSKHREANSRIEALCAGNEQLHYIDIFTPMMSGPNTAQPDIFLGDGIHMNKKGYEIWTDVIRKALDLPEN